MKKVELEPAPPCEHKKTHLEYSNWFDNPVEPHRITPWKYRWRYTMCDLCNEQIGPAWYEEAK